MIQQKFSRREKLNQKWNNFESWKKFWKNGKPEIEQSSKTLYKIWNKKNAKSAKCEKVHISETKFEKLNFFRNIKDPENIRNPGENPVRKPATCFKIGNWYIHAWISKNIWDIEINEKNVTKKKKETNKKETL